MLTASTQRTLEWGLFALALAWFLALPLWDVLAYPERLSVLPNLETDAAAYDAFALEFSQTWQRSSLPAKHPPGWMVVLAGVYAVLGHSYVAGKIVSWLALGLTVGLTAWLAHRLHGRTAAIIAALLCASSPGLRAYVGTLQYEVLTAALFTLFLALSVRVVDAQTARGTIRRSVLAGLAGAALVLTRETFVLVVPIAALWIWSQRRAPDASSAPSAPSAPRAPGWLCPLVVVMFAAAPAVAWSAVQSVHHQRLILIADKTREVFDAGHNPRANGTYNEPLSGIGQPAGFAFIRQFPARTLELAGRKFLYSFGILRDGWNVPHPPAVWIWRATTGVVPLALIEPIAGGGWLLVIVAIGLFTPGQRSLAMWWLLPASVGVILAVHVLSLASYRFAIPLLPILYVLASGPLAQLARSIAHALRTPAIAAAAAVIALASVAAQFQSWPLDARYRAAALDGLAASNELDDVSGSMARVGAAEGRERPIALLPDTYLPRGQVRVTARLRRTSPGAPDSTPVARVALVPLYGRGPCVSEVFAGQLTADHFTDVDLLCQLDRDGPVTLAVFSLGQVDLAIDTVRLVWIR